MPHTETSIHQTASCQPAILSAQAARAARAIVMTGSRVTPAEVALTRLVRRGLYVTLPALDGVLGVHLAENAPEDWDDSLLLSGPAGAIDIAAGARLIRGLTGIDPRELPDAGSEHIQWLQAALAGRLAQTPFAGADCLAHDADFDSTDALPLRVTLRTQHHQIDTHARAGIAAWQNLLSRAAWSYERAPLPECLDLPFESTISVAHHTLPAPALRGLAMGDIILPDTPRFGPDGEGLIRLGDREVRVRYSAPCSLEIIAVEGKVNAEQYGDEADGAAADDTQYEDGGAGADEEAGFDEAEEQAYDEARDEADTGEVDQESGEQDGGYEEDPDTGQADDGAFAAAQDAEDDAMDDDAYQGQPAGADEADSGELDAVPVTLSFELGRIAVPLGDLRTLGAGAVVLLDGGSPASISIVSGGKTLGHGEAVDVDGSLGIRITQWGAQS